MVEGYPCMSIGGFFMSKKNKVLYFAGAYKRLSQEDGNGEVSNSIINQTELIKDYIKSQKNMELVAEYDDDGYSGVHFERPAFQQMLEDIKEKKINCVIVKDLSRFGRNYIEAGKYIERIFPFLGVRFISINDYYDSEGEKNELDTLMLPFKNLMNDAYCRDISMKIRSQLEIKRKNGECISAFAVYGYEKSKENRHQLVIDEYAAGIVKTIFNMKLHGSNQQKIAEFLNESGVLSPLEYKKAKGEKYSTSFQTHKVAKWSINTINRILTDEVYTGVMVQGKTERPNYKVKTQISKSPKEWIRVEGTHEAIISSSHFDTVQELLKRDTRTAPQKEEVYLFSGYLFCGDCQNSMIRKVVPSGKKKYHYYICSTNKYSKKCSSHSINEKKVIDKILQVVKGQIEMIYRLDEFLSYLEHLPEKNRNIFDIDKQITKLQEEINKYKSIRRRLYEDLNEGVIDKKEYIEYKSNFTQRIEEKEEIIVRLQEKRGEELEQNGSQHPWIEKFKQHQNILELERQLVVSLIHKIFVYESGRLEVVFRYKNGIEKLFLNGEISK